MGTDINKDFIFRHFARKTSTLQRELIAQWLRDPKNEETYYEWLEEWETRHPQYIAPTERAYEQYRAYLDANANTDEVTLLAPVVPLHASPWWNRPWFMAASIIVLLGLTAFFLRDRLQYQTYRTVYGETRALTLSDGSRVRLNPNSQLRVPRWGFGQRTREVWLTGEADFSVTHTLDNSRFVVKTNKNVEVVVLGTEFTVFARNRGARVALTKGQIQLQYRDGGQARELLMKPGQLATFEPGRHMALTAVKPTSPLPLSAGNRFVFDETPLREVAFMLEERYGLQVQISSPELADRVLVGSIQAGDPDQLLQFISELLDINVIRQENRVQLTSH
ncbi:FecR family protein [Rudanella lutea]|uniref:FecR family protein n=1 Tax=Rudanella lutea TaxID=451374 RepID=UPI000364AA43|nr:FecR domain-containing protein [Rudanella lutea]